MSGFTCSRFRSAIADGLDAVFPAASAPCAEGAKATSPNTPPAHPRRTLTSLPTSLLLTPPSPNHRVEQHLKRQVTLRPILRPHPEQHHMPGPHRRIDQRRLPRDHLLADEPPRRQHPRL